MSDERTEELRTVDDGDTTLRDEMQQDGTVELTGSDLEPISGEGAARVVVGESVEADDAATQLIEQRRIEAAAAADADLEQGPTHLTRPNPAVKAATTDFQVPDDLLARAITTSEQTQKLALRDDGTVIAVDEGADMSATQKMQAVGTRPLPSVDDAEETVERSLSESFDVDEDGFATFIARPNKNGHIVLPPALQQAASADSAGLVLIKVKVLDREA